MKENKKQGKSQDISHGPRFSDPIKKGGVQTQNVEDGASREEDQGEGFGGSSKPSKNVGPGRVEKSINEPSKGSSFSKGDRSRRDSGRDL